MLKAPLHLILLSICGAMPVRAGSEAVLSPGRQYSVHLKLSDSPYDSFRYRSATLFDQRSGRALQVLTRDGLGFNKISVRWSADGTMVAVYCVHKRDGWTEVYRIKDNKAEKLVVPEFPLPTKQDLHKLSYSRFDYREPIQWNSDNTLILGCTGKVQLRDTSAPNVSFLPEWFNYRYQIQVGFKRAQRGSIRSVKKVSLEYESEKN